MTLPRITHLITVDTECSSHPGDLGVTGCVGREAAGALAIGEVLRAHGLKATWFVDVYEADPARARRLREVCGRLRAAGHDLQLHTHPDPGRARTNGQMARHTFDEQVAILRYGLARFQEWFGEAPVAHRAGDWAANDDTLRALRAVGIPMDSSWYYGWPDCAVGNGERPSLQPRVIEGVLEIPPTVFLSPGFGLFRPYRLFTTDGQPGGELLSVLRSLRRGPPALVVSVFHSFSFLEWNRRRTRYWVARRKMTAFTRFLTEVARAGDGSLTMRELHAAYAQDPADVLGRRGELPRSPAYFVVPRLMDRARLALGGLAP